MLGAAVYAQYRIPFHSATVTQSWITRIMLGVIGVGVGLISVGRSQEMGAPLFLVFLSGFGAVHVPAAFILFIKRQRGKEVKQKDNAP
jgi:hypothetical protein